ncbi:hypothetical protein [Micromonospora sp. NPDC049891]|uniref:hypothetical protein n=1 Tax=Micromonospora sp. NPDC049891 TaxID=3155655 RepID=UPI0033FD2E9D
MRLILYAATITAGVAIALAAGQEPAHADDPISIGGLLDTATSGTSQDRPTPVRDTVKTVTDPVDKTVSGTVDTVKQVTEPVPVVGKVVGTVTDRATTQPVAPADKQPPAREGTQPEPEPAPPAANRTITPPPTATTRSGPTTVPELAKQPPRATSSGTPPITVRQKQPTHDTGPPQPARGRTTDANQPEPSDGTDLGDMDRTPATTNPIPVDADGTTDHTTAPRFQAAPTRQPHHIRGRQLRPAPPSG